MKIKIQYFFNRVVPNFIVRLRILKFVNVYQGLSIVLHIGLEFPQKLHIALKFSSNFILDFFKILSKSILKSFNNFYEFLLRFF